jgi:hypothetical protein
VPQRAGDLARESVGLMTQRTVGGANYLPTHLLKEIVFSGVPLPLLKIRVPAETVRLDANLLHGPCKVDPELGSVRARDGVLTLRWLEAVPSQGTLDLYLEGTLGEARADLPVPPRPPELR